MATNPRSSILGRLAKRLAQLDAERARLLLAIEVIESITPAAQTDGSRLARKTLASVNEHRVLAAPKKTRGKAKTRRASPTSPKPPSELGQVILDVIGRRDGLTFPEIRDVLQLKGKKARVAGVVLGSSLVKKGLVKRHGKVGPKATYSLVAAAS